VKIAILMPVHGEAKGAYAEAALNMVAHTAGLDVNYNGRSVRPEIRAFRVSRSNVSLARNLLLDEALRWAADYALFNDVDHTFPADALVRLLKHQVPFVGCNYPQRMHPDVPTAMVKAGGPFLTSDAAAAARQPLVEVEAIGLGFCLLNMSILPALQRQADAQGRSLWPLFKDEWADGKVSITGEDVYFCGRLREAGVRILVDQALSLEIGHIAETVLRL
jgi:hypothetical protein